MSLKANAIQIIDDWYSTLDVYQDKLPSKGTIAASLHVLQRLRLHFDLDIASHVAAGEAQITGLSAATLKRILSEFGESRQLSSVGGRSNRGARGDVARLLGAMAGLHLEELAENIRNATLSAMQRHIVTTYVVLFFSVKRVKAIFDPTAATSGFIEAILENARQSGKAGAVAEHLVGAKLALRFPEMTIRNKQFNTSDAQGGFSGDFEIGNTVFHVTLAPMPELFAKLRANLERGHRVYLLVPRAQVIGTAQNASLLAPGKIAVEPIESFISTNIDELAEFDGNRLKSGLRRLLEKYNERVAAVEIDKSLLIEPPPNLD